MQPHPLIAVRDVEASSRWYQKLLACQSGHGGPNYEMLMYEGELIMQLHRWNDGGACAHVNLEGKPGVPSGHGVLLWFATDTFEAAVQRARELEAEVVEEPHLNKNAGQWEIWLRDRDGYVVVLAGPRES